MLRIFDHEMIDPSKQIHYFRQGKSSEYVPQGDTFFGGTCLEMVGGRPAHIFNKSGTRQCTRAVWSTVVEIHYRYPPRFIDVLFGVTGISG